MTFEEHVLPWLKDAVGDAVAVERVEADGADMTGDTEGGFYPSFSVTIVYRDAAGRERRYTVEGEDMASLWSHAVAAPAPPPAAAGPGRRALSSEADALYSELTNRVPNDYLHGNWLALMADTDKDVLVAFLAEVLYVQRERAARASRP